MEIINDSFDEILSIEDVDYFDFMQLLTKLPEDTEFSDQIKFSVLGHNPFVNTKRASGYITWLTGHCMIV